MSHYNQDPSNDNNSGTREQVPHSGVHGYEKPVREFDNTSLAEAHEKGLLETHDTPAALVGDKKEPRFSLGKKVGAAIAGLGLAGTGLFLATQGGGDHNTEPRQEPTASAPANPSENASQAPSTGETTTDSPAETTGYILSAEKYTNNPELLVSDFFNDFNKWLNTGSSKKAANDMERFTLGDDEAYAQELNQKSDTEFENDMLVDNWQSIPSLAQWYETNQHVHVTTTAIALKTTDSGNQADLEPYARYIDLDAGSIQVKKSTPDEVVVHVEFTGRDNRDKNRGAEITAGGIDPNTETGDLTLTFERVGENMKLSDVAY